MRSEQVRFDNGRGIELAARVELPVGREPRACALFAHCFTCSKDLKAARTISRALAQQGIAVMRFDFTGLGESGGDFAQSHFAANVGDLLAAAQWMERAMEGPAILVGHSLGGAAVLKAAGRIESVRAVATIGAPHDPQHITHLFGDALDTIRETGEAEVRIGGRAFTVTREFLEALEGGSMDETLRRLGRALLVFHSPTDRVVGVDNAAAIYKAAKHPKSFISLDGADHLLTRRADAEYVATMLAGWAARYVPMAAEQEAEAEARLDARGSQVVARTDAEGFRTDVRAGTHPLVADEPESVGGTDTGPTPYGLLLAGLGACTGMTLRMYAQRKGWPLEATEVRLTHSRKKGEDCEPCAGRGGFLDHIDRRIELHGDLDDAQRARLLEIADKCPVHRTLESDIVIETRSDR